MLISRRGSSTAAAQTVIADQTFYVASVLGGKPDLELSFVSGVPQSITPPANRSLEVFSYSVGALPTLNGGYGWNGNGAVVIPYFRLVSEEAFETYNEGGISGAAITGGTGWNGAAALFAY
jgi:hypothetical protein